MHAGGRTTTRRGALGVAVGALGAAVGGCSAPSSPGSPSAPPGRGPVPFPTGPLDTSTLLPYGTRYLTDTGAVITLDRVAGPALDATGDVAFADPGFIRFVDVATVAALSGEVACELGLFAFPETVVDGRTVAANRRAATVAFGDVAAVAQWDAARTPAGTHLGFVVDAATGALYDVAAKPLLDEFGEERWTPLFEEVMATGSAAVRVDGRTAAVMFDCGVGDGWYPAYLGRDAGGRTVALAADLELHHRLSRAPVGGRS